MKVLVLGAGGRTGALVVERARAAGHEVSALVRDPAKTTFAAGVRVIGGDARDSMSVRQAVAGQEAVIDCVGGKTPWKATQLEETVARQVIDAMQAEGARRLIVVSALGVGASKAQSPLWYRWLMLPTFLRGSTRDKNAMEQRVKTSAREFVLTEPPILSDAPPTGKTIIVSNGSKAHKITRADLAQFLVEQLSSDAFVGQAVVVANS